MLSMINLKFKAYAVTNEIDLNSIAVKCGIPKKYTWEEPLVLRGELLSSILRSDITEDKSVLVFAFGSVVFINIENQYIRSFIEYLKATEAGIDVNNFNKYSDDYELHIDENAKMSFTDQYAVVPRFEVFYPELISTVIAKSVALEKTEEQLGKILDTLEGRIDELERGSLGVSNKELARTTARIVRHEYNTIAYIMILDKPDITWTNTDAALFYDKMSDFFELNDRYEIIKKKTDILNLIMNGFSSISHSIRGLFVEWVIVILIIVEVILMVADFFR